MLKSELKTSYSFFLVFWNGANSVEFWIFMRALLILMFCIVLFVFLDFRICMQHASAAMSILILYSFSLFFR